MIRIKRPLSISIGIEKTKICDKYIQRIKFQVKFDLLIIDDWLIVKVTPQQQEYLFKVMEGRNDLHSTIFES